MQSAPCGARAGDAWQPDAYVLQSFDSVGEPAVGIVGKSTKSIEDTLASPITGQPLVLGPVSGGNVAPQCAGLYILVRVYTLGSITLGSSPPRTRWPCPSPGSRWKWAHIRRQCRAAVHWALHPGRSPHSRVQALGFQVHAGHTGLFDACLHLGAERMGC